MWLTEWEYKLYVDPALSLCMVCLMLRSVWPLLIESAMILLQTVPSHIDIEELRSKLLQQCDGVLAVHEFHIWQLAGDRIIASAHIRCLNLSEYMKVAENIKEFFHNNGIHSTTIQPEFLDCNGYLTGTGSTSTEPDKRSDKIMNEQDCALTCPKDQEKAEPNCQASKCCPDPQVLAAVDPKSRSEPNTPRMSQARERSWKRNSFTYESGGGGAAIVTGTGHLSDNNPEVQILMPPCSSSSVQHPPSGGSLNDELLLKSSNS